MKKLIAITGTEQDTHNFTKTMVMRHGWHMLDATYPVKAAAAAFFSVPITAFNMGEVDHFDLVWGMTYRAMLKRTEQAMRDEFGQDVLARRWLSTFLPLADQENVLAIGLDEHVMATVAEFGGEVIDVTGRDLAELALEMSGKVPV